MSRTGESKTCTIIFAGRRDNYELAKAFRDAGWRTILVTDLAGISSRRLPLPAGMRRDLEARSRELEGIEIKCSLSSLLDFIYKRVTRRSATPRMAERLGEEGAREANRHGGLLVSYSTYGYRAFARADARLGKILFQMHPHADTCMRVARELEPAGKPASSSVDWEDRLSAESLAEYRQEWKAADGILTASSFTTNSLLEAGACPERIRAVPYGGRLPRIAGGERPPARRIKLLYVGAFIRRKGAMDLAELTGRLGDRVETHAAGRGLQEAEVWDAFRTAGVRTYWNASDSELARLRAECDLFVFPSYLEGFGHVILESMLAGLPILSTERTCAADLLVSSRHGWIVRAGDVDGLVAQVQWAADRLDLVRAMRPAVANRGREYTWERFRKNAVGATECLLEQARVRSAGE